MKLSEIQLVSEIQALFSENNEYDAIKADIAERGIQDPVKVNKHNQLLAGYTRLKIAQELGLYEAPHVVSETFYGSRRCRMRPLLWSWDLFVSGV